MGLSFSLVVILIVDQFDIRFDEPECDPVVSVHPDRVVPGQVAFESVGLVVLLEDEVWVGDGQRSLDPVGARTSSRDIRFAASPSFIISESPASCRRSSAR